MIQYEANSESTLRELTAAEISQVSGGLYPELGGTDSGWEHVGDNCQIPSSASDQLGCYFAPPPPYA